MNKLVIKKSLIMATIAIFVISTMPVLVNALGDNSRNQEDVRITNVQERVEEIKLKREAIKTRLEENKLKSCQKREQAINNIITRINDRSSKQLSVFTKIYEKVEAFYVEKGNILDNHDTLVADVVSAKSSAEAVAARATEMNGTFKCSSEDPKGDFLAFKEYQNEQKEALKVYKTSIKDLIVGVKSVQSETGDQQ